MTQQDGIKLLIVDDHEMVRRGLMSFLRTFDDLAVVGEASNGEEAIDACERLHPDVVIMDLMMPGMDGFAATQIIRERFPEVTIIALSSSGDTKSVTAAMQAGAISYLLKNVGTDQLAEAIRAAVRGQRRLSPEATQALIRAATRPPERRYDLTEREAEVLALMVEGLNNPDIAQRLNVSRSTVKYHISAILSKLGVSNRSEAIALAIKQNMV